MKGIVALAAGTVSGAQPPLITDTIAGNVVVIGSSVVGLLGAAMLYGLARGLRAERRDPLDQPHYLDF